MTKFWMHHAKMPIEIVILDMTSDKFHRSVFSHTKFYEAPLLQIKNCVCELDKNNQI